MGSKSDRKLAAKILDLRDAYGVFENDHDGYRLGMRHFEKVGDKLMGKVEKLFNRVAEDGLKEHPSLAPVFQQLEKLSPKDRINTDKVYQSLREVLRMDLKKN